MSRKLIYVLWPLSVVVAALLGAAAQVTLDVNQNTAGWLPKGATNGCRYSGGSFILGPSAFYREYSISEADFLDAFDYRKVDFKEVEEPLWVPRYYERVLCKAALPGGGDVTGEVETKNYEEYRRATHAVITDGLVYERQFEDQMTIIAYDREAGRAYFYDQTR